MRYRGLLPFAPRQDVILTSNPFESLHREIDRLFENSSFASMRELVPTIDVSDDDKGLKVVVELAGVDEKDVHVSITGDVLTIKGEKKTDREESKGNYHIMERSFGSFNRSLRLPYEVDATKVDAKFEKGVLTVILPKTKSEKNEEHKIDIKVK